MEPIPFQERKLNIVSTFAGLYLPTCYGQNNQIDTGNVLMEKHSQPTVGISDASTSTYKNS